MFFVGLFQNFTEETATDSIPFKECLYYLKTYASFNIIIDFYRRNGYWMKAVQYILDHVCVILFILQYIISEYLTIPYFNDGITSTSVNKLYFIYVCVTVQSLENCLLFLYDRKN